MKKPAHRRLFLLSIREISANCRSALTSDLVRFPTKIKNNTTRAAMSENELGWFHSK